ncbi:hypothetical protein OIO90_006234 [Microbotryomycetes sp. JL221]|nr:hypothetical protein OIO90_006234 [Microbotryomycetes sp. JL221]
MSGAEPTHIADAVLPTFAKAVLNVLTVWPALRLAVSHHWGGRQGTTELAEDLVDLFYSTATEVDAAPNTTAVPDVDDIEAVLLHVVSHAFNVSLEDGSETTIARDLLALWQECVARCVTPPPHSSALFEKFAAAADKAKAEDGDRKFSAQRAGADENGDDDSDDSTDDDESDDNGMDMDEATSSRGTTHDDTRGQLEPEVDDEGFTLVTKKSGSRRI